MLNQPRRAQQLVVLSGKGGTGKTSLCAAFAHLANQNSLSAIFVDADVDAANLSLVLRPNQSETHEFWGGSLAEITPHLCTGCGACESVCRYDAALPDPHSLGKYAIDPIACDGCAACVYACPEEAIRMVQQQEGNWFHSQTAYGELFHAELFPGRENSGKLVTLVKQQARLRAEESHLPLMVVDGPPGIGCPVISACAGADLGLVVTEPSLAGLHDLKRVFGTLQHFHVPVLVCINKADLYPEGARQIREFAEEQGVEIAGEIPFDESVPQAMLAGLPINEMFPKSPAAQAAAQTWAATMARMMDLQVNR
ncbi:(4Fe-4S)-binding protein [Ornatilinea apprima]|uniref:(4Fe-4S)-binding protein n=1 Tax=Ornatilinea apprima TaxID=1134406 RepID=A0A0P6YAF2_9CHLR|nr:ATP-binding protein [Ornatilinea apprima]KPL78823.1 (4Fe-4S)-binding protein [Ornatilinea apprima]